MRFYSSGYHFEMRFYFFPGFRLSMLLRGQSVLLLLLLLEAVCFLTEFSYQLQSFSFYILSGCSFHTLLSLCCYLLWLVYFCFHTLLLNHVSPKKKVVVPVASTRSQGSTSVAVSQVERARTLSEWKTLSKEALVLPCNALFISALGNQATLAPRLFNHYLNNEIDDQIVTLGPILSTENASSLLLGQSSASPVAPFISSPGIQTFLHEQLN